MSNSTDEEVVLAKETQPADKGKWRIWRKRLHVVMAVVAVLLGGYHFLTRSSNVTSLATAVLEKLTGAEVSVRSASFSISGRVVLNDVTLDRPNASGPVRRIIEAREVIIYYDHWHLFLLKFVPRRIEIPGPVIYVTYDADQQIYNFQYRIAEDDAKVGSEPPVPLSIPEVILTDGELRFSEVLRGSLIERGTLPITGQVKASDQAAGISTFDLRQDGIGWANAPKLSGVIDLQDSSIRAELSQLSHEIFNSSQGRVLLGPVADVWREMQPTGSLPRVLFGYDPDPEIGFYADIIVEDIALSIPFTEAENRISDVEGHFIVNNQQVCPDLKGRVSTEKFDFDYQVNGSLKGFKFKTPFVFSVHADGEIKDVLHEGESLWPLPENIERIFGLYNIVGRVRANVKAQREQVGEKTTFDGTVFLEDCDGQFSKFPFPLTNINGELRFDEDKVELVSIRGNGLHGGDVIVTGVVTPPRRYSKVDINVTGVDVPIDKLLLDALPPNAVPLVKRFFNNAAATELYQQGVIQKQSQYDQLLNQIDEFKRRLLRLEKSQQGEEPEANEIGNQLELIKQSLEVPVFELGGLISVQTTSSRPAGEGERFTTISEVDLSGVNLLCDFWPYPLHIKQGKIVVSPKRVEILDVEFEGLSGGTGVVSGFVELPSEGKPLKPDIKITAKAVAIDQLLISSIPSPHDKLLLDQHIEGQFDAVASVFSRPDGKVDFKVEAELKNATARPYLGEFALEHLEGKLVLQRDDVVFESLSCRKGDATIDLNGHASWKKGKAVLDLSVEARGLNFNDPVLDLMGTDDPQVVKAKKIIKSYDPKGEFDASLTYRIHEQRDAEYNLEIRPRNLVFKLRGNSIELADMSGRVLVLPGRIELDGIRSVYGENSDGYVKVSGVVRHGEKIEADVVFSAGSPVFDAATRVMLPEDVVNIIDQMNLQCRFEVKQGRLQILYASDDQQIVDFHGVIILDNAKATIGMPITEMTGKMLIDAHHDVSQVYPLLNIQVQADQLRIADRMVSPLSAKISSSEDGSVLMLSDIRGWCYGGLLTGRGSVELNRDNLTQMHMELVDSKLDSFLHPLDYKQNSENAQASSDEKVAQSKGYLSTNISIEVTPDDVSSRRGRGRIEVREAELYDFPVAIAVMQIVNIALPQVSSFDQATVLYLIDGDNIQFDKVSLNAPTLEIVGTGTMDYSTLELDMNLVSRNPSPIRMGAVSELFDVFKDELISIKVVGTLDDPKATGESLSGIKQSLRNIFGEDTKESKQKSQLGDGGANKSGQ